MAPGCRASGDPGFAPIKKPEIWRASLERHTTVADNNPCATG